MSMNLSATAYWQQTHRPLVNLVFVLPLLLGYELGVCWLGEEAAPVRNGADEWLRTLSYQVFGWRDALVPMFVVSLLVAWHVALHDRWAVRLDTMAGMAAESLLFASLLVLAGQVIDGLWHPVEEHALATVSAPASWTTVRFIHFLGAGLYEEFVFRLGLIPVAYVALRMVLLPQKWALWGSVIVTSVLFGLAHYLTPQSEATLLTILTDAAQRVQSREDLWFGFLFRTLAGIAFGSLFLCRGLGVAVGCHTAYDVVVGIVLMSEL